MVTVSLHKGILQGDAQAQRFIAPAFCQIRLKKSRKRIIASPLTAFLKKAPGRFRPGAGHSRDG
jgi:hypothetical protein